MINSGKNGLVEIIGRHRPRPSSCGRRLPEKVIVYRARRRGSHGKRLHVLVARRRRGVVPFSVLSARRGKLNGEAFDVASVTELLIRSRSAPALSARPPSWRCDRFGAAGGHESVGFRFSWSSGSARRQCYSTARSRGEDPVRRLFCGN